MEATLQTSLIRISDKARDELVKLEVNHENFLRLWVVAGGCKGFTYQAAIDNQIDDGDTVIFKTDVFSVIADPESVQYFDGLEIDYSDDMVQGGFRFLNPNATGTCGCGSSFCSN
jgi:iron-sulfur cluster assembly protein